MLHTDIQFLKGVGEKRSALYGKLGIHNVRDLLYHFPREYINLSHPEEISSAPIGSTVAIRGTVLAKGHEQHIRKGLSVFKIQIADDTAQMSITFFNAKYTVDSLKLDETYLFYGKIGGTFLRKEMTAPMIYPLLADMPFVPVYPLTAGLSSKMITANVRQAFSLLKEEILDPIPAFIREQYHLCHIDYALKNIHLPQSLSQAEIARRRLIFEELFFLSLTLGNIKSKNIASTSFIMKEKGALKQFCEKLPFRPTDAQKRVMKETAADMEKAVPMNRLVQGDVGCGKTLVGAAAAYLAFQNNYQSAFMAPTELLAQQHYQSLHSLLSPFGMRIALLTGSTKAKEKREIYGALSAGEIDLCVGTHALLSKGVEFLHLGLVITDEQHRFGVEQRQSLSKKSENPHTLVMSATPIPRTLALIVYGDLDVSVIDQMPVGRLPISTYLIDSGKRSRAFGFIKKHLDSGKQAYIVCPLIEQGEIDLGLKTAVDYKEELTKTYFKGYSIGLLHSRMKAAEKEAVMRSFKEGTCQLLVSTTVVEVGVDVPNAVIMMIEDADRFGLSQLHQLRGRVGRGSDQSHCILLSDNQNEETRKRLHLLCQTADGFQVAEFDLKARGPGDFFGSRQHGLPVMKLADLAKDMELLTQAKQAAQQLDYEKLSLSEKEGIDREIGHMLLNVGQRLN